MPLIRPLSFSTFNGRTFSNSVSVRPNPLQDIVPSVTRLQTQLPSTRTNFTCFLPLLCDLCEASTYLSITGVWKGLSLLFSALKLVPSFSFYINIFLQFYKRFFHSGPFKYSNQKNSFSSFCFSINMRVCGVQGSPLLR